MKSTISFLYILFHSEPVCSLTVACVVLLPFKFVHAVNIRAVAVAASFRVHNLDRVAGRYVPLRQLQDDGELPSFFFYGKQLTAKVIGCTRE